jgi:hypothetical protein
MNYFKLDRATVSCVVQMLEAAGWIVRSRGVPTRRIGRPTEVLWINSNAGLFLGLAFEANLIRMVAAGLDDKPRANLTFPNVPGRGQVGPQIKRVVRSILKACAAGPDSFATSAGACRHRSTATVESSQIRTSVPRISPLFRSSNP